MSTGCVQDLKTWKCGLVSNLEVLGPKVKARYLVYNICNNCVVHGEGQHMSKQIKLNIFDSSPWTLYPWKERLEFRKFDILFLWVGIGVWIKNVHEAFQTSKECDKKWIILQVKYVTSCA